MIGLEGGPADAIYLVFVLIQRGKDGIALGGRILAARLYLFNAPNNDCLVLGGGGKQGALSVHTYLPDPVRVSLTKRLDAVPGGRVPELDGLISRAGNKEVAAWGKKFNR